MIEINLLESSKAKGAKKSYDSGKKNLFFLILIAVVLIEVVAISLYTLNMNNKISILTQKVNSLRNVEKEVHIIKAKIKEVKIMTTTIKNLEKGRGVAYKNLRDIADVMPNGLWLTRITKRKELLKIEGKSFTTEAVAQYMTSLGNLKNVAKVNFDSRGLVKLPSKNGVDIYKFYIAVALRD